jgi:RHS repeat-associated protein
MTSPIGSTRSPSPTRASSASPSTQQVVTGTGANTTTLDTYAYIGSSDTVSVDVSSAGAGNTLEAGIDAMGDRLSTAASTGFAWIVPDLHGNVAAQCSSSGSVSDVFRYDAYGKLIGTSLTAGSVPSPWRFQGRILESTAGSDTYDFGARAYVPDLGTFTSLDSVAGSAQNPITLNRYLYANANPATLVDPDGHCVEDACIIEGGTALYLLAMATVAVYSAAVAQTNPEVRAAEGDAVANAQQNISNFFSTTWTVPYPNIPLADRGKPGPPPWTLPKPTIAPRTIPQGQGPPDPVPGGPETQPAPPSGQNPFTGLPKSVKTLFTWAMRIMLFVIPGSQLFGHDTSDPPEASPSPSPSPKFKPGPMPSPPPPSQKPQSFTWPRGQGLL